MESGETCRAIVLATTYVAVSPLRHVQAHIGRTMGTKTTAVGAMSACTALAPLGWLKLVEQTLRQEVFQRI